MKHFIFLHSCLLFLLNSKVQLIKSSFLLYEGIQAQDVNSLLEQFEEGMLTLHSYIIKATLTNENLIKGDVASL